MRAPAGKQAGTDCNSSPATPALTAGCASHVPHTPHQLHQPPATGRAAPRCVSHPQAGWQPPPSPQLQHRNTHKHTVSAYHITAQCVVQSQSMRGASSSLCQKVGQQKQNTTGPFGLPDQLPRQIGHNIPPVSGTAACRAAPFLDLKMAPSTRHSTDLRSALLPLLPLLPSLDAAAPAAEHQAARHQLEAGKHTHAQQACAAVSCVSQHPLAGVELEFQTEHAAVNQNDSCLAAVSTQQQPTSFSKQLLSNSFHLVECQCPAAQTGGSSHELSTSS